MGIDVTFQGVSQVMLHFDSMPMRILGAYSDTMNDLKRRIPPTVSKCVRKVYNVRAGEIIPSKVKTSKPTSMITHMRVQGNNLATLQFVYTGRLLTPVHFDMSPMSASPNPPSPYVLTMRVFKNGGRKKFGQHLAVHHRGGPYSEKSGNILFPTKGKAEHGKYTHYPSQRIVKGWHPKGTESYKKFTTLSMPQMVSSKWVRDDLNDQIEHLVNKRLIHNLERHLYAG